MADDPVREALEAAALSVAQEQCDRVMDEDRRACVAGGACTCRVNAAAAVAAFLRAMPAYAVVLSPRHLAMWNTTAAHEVAAAVERAAKEAGDE